MPALLQLEVYVQIQVLQDGVCRGQLAAEPTLGGALEVVLALDVQICLKQVVHHYETHLHLRVDINARVRARSPRLVWLDYAATLVASDLLDH